MPHDRELVLGCPDLGRGHKPQEPNPTAAEEGTRQVTNARSSQSEGPPEGPGLRTTHAEDTVELALTGELDLSYVAMLREELGRALERASRAGDAPTRLIVDLRSLTFIDSSGIQVLVAAKRRATQNGVELSLRVGDSPTRRMLSLAGVADFLGLGD
jgi:anti-anti-sigma factor